MMELEREAKEGLEKVRKEWQSVNELAVKDPFKCAAAAIQTLEDGVKLLLEYGFGEIVEFNEKDTVQKAIRESSFFNVFGMNGVNNANSLYLIARYWVDKRVPADVANELCKKLNDFYATLSNAFAANCGYKPKNTAPAIQPNVPDQHDFSDPATLFDEATNSGYLRQQEKHIWTYGENLNVCEFTRDHFVKTHSEMTLDEIIDKMNIVFGGKIKSSSIKMKFQNMKALLNYYGIRNTLPCATLQNWSNDHENAFKKIFQ